MSEYYLIDLTSNWLSYIFPMINWFIPKKCIQISKEEFERLNLLKDIKNKNIGFIAGTSIFLSVTLRKYVNLLDVNFERVFIILYCFLGLIGTLCFLLYLKKKLSLDISMEKDTSKLLLIPSIRSIIFLFFFWILFGLFSLMSFWMLVIDNIQNIIVFISLILMTIIFLCSNMVSFNDTKVRAKLITKEIEK
ncbi:hypothetical protein GCM10010896_13190 [Mammaliicoccus stepanovicii]|uniref:Tandem five-TM protein n=1 Tax=Mammaliicoccus stepanovicii TaxID=643214 RepID=A0A239ZQW4_9STAP|nr:DUF443 domain-containing protein [Mammaliicoccus stepanovicii]GGI41405.1 hypothetical protein GCM10010896_13190 [Mammaliicoccus stepanovicii]SNV72986.1 tandem five-TM protein [Mammaliicoccus stepanovicii]